MATTIEAPIKTICTTPTPIGSSICMHTYTWSNKNAETRPRIAFRLPLSLSPSLLPKTHASAIALWLCSMSNKCTLIAPVTTASPPSSSSAPPRAWPWRCWWCSCKRARRRRRRRARKLRRRRTTPLFTPTSTSLPCLKESDPASRSRMRNLSMPRSLPPSQRSDCCFQDKTLVFSAEFSKRVGRPTQWNRNKQKWKYVRSAAEKSVKQNFRNPSNFCF